jgi:hypothetical protein
MSMRKVFSSFFLFLVPSSLSLFKRWHEPVELEFLAQLFVAVANVQNGCQALLYRAWSAAK